MIHHDQLMEAANVVVTNNAINNAITAHIRRIRDKFREVDSTFDSIRTEYGMGYCWLVKTLKNAMAWFEKYINKNRACQ